jgi:hypothetical protein
VVEVIAGTSGHSWEGLVERAFRASGVKPPLWDQELLAGPPFKGRALVGGRQVGDLIPAFPCILDPNSFRSQWALLCSLKRRIGRKISETQSIASRLRRLSDDLERKLLAASNRLFEDSWLDKTKAYISGRASSVRAFREAYDNYHRIHSQLAEAELSEALLVDATQKVHCAAKVFDAFAQRLRSTLAALSDGSDSRISSGFIFKPLEAVFGELAAAVKRGNVPGLRAYLPTTADALTIGGLAGLAMVEPTPDSIARRLMEQPEFESPFWGGMPPHHDPVTRIVVLPPVEPAVLSSVQEAMDRCGLSSHIAVSADSLAAGASILLIELYEVTSAGELFPRPYRAALQQILTGTGLYAPTPRAREFAETILAGDPTREAV